MRGPILGYFGSGGTEGCMGQNERGERKVRGMRESARSCWLGRSMILCAFIVKIDT